MRRTGRDVTYKVIARVSRQTAITLPTAEGRSVSPGNRATVAAAIREWADRGSNPEPSDTRGCTMKGDQ